MSVISLVIALLLYKANKIQDQTAKKNLPWMDKVLFFNTVTGQRNYESAYSKKKKKKFLFLMIKKNCGQHTNYSRIAYFLFFSFHTQYDGLKKMQYKINMITHINYLLF